MRYFSCIVSGLLLNASALAQSPATDPHWVLVEHWDFKTMNSTALNQDWVTDPCVKALDHANGDVEPQSYQAGNVTISSTGLKLTAKEESVLDQVICYLPNNAVLSDGVQNYRWSYKTSGFVETKDSLKYGYIEARMKLPYCFDFWPAFWTFQMSSAAINASEIDIFEMLPSEQTIPDYPYNYDIQKTNVHLAYDGSDPNRNENLPINDYRQYHVYGVEWSPSKIIWYVDDQIVRVLSNPGVHDYTKTILNLALTPFVSLDPYCNYPASMEVDYVKWYKLNNAACNTVINDCAFYFGGYQTTVKKSITISGSSCSNTQPIGTSLILRATDFVQLNGEFTVPLGSSLYVDVNSCY